MSQSKDRVAVLGKRIHVLDTLLVHYLVKRIRTAEQVAMIKIEEGKPIYNKERETQRLQAMADLGQKEGINPDFVRSILYGIIDESCKRQMVLADKWRITGESEKFNPTYDEMRQNLLILTQENAPQYENYGEEVPAMEALISYERALVDKVIAKIKNRKLMLEIGSATGREMRRLHAHFVNLKGFDISQHMVDEGNKINQKMATPNVSLDVHDIETIWPIEDNSVSFVLMNQGTGSDVRDLKFILSEIERVLAVDGRFVLSFYNKNAWTQQIFFPWPLGLVTGIDQDRSCLEVLSNGVYRPVYAKPYSVKEIQEAMKPILKLDGRPQTYPTLFSILPSEITARMQESKVLPQIDGKLATHSSDLGSYIIVSGSKK